MKTHFIRYTKSNGVATIILNRPDVLNSFSIPMAKELQAALADCAADTNIRAILLSGEGRAFCAGQDLAEAAPADREWPPLEHILQESYNPIILAIREIEKPVICAVNGVAAGAGANIALACDFVIASEKASFLQAFCHIGLVPDSGGSFFLPRLVGLARATAMTMLGGKIPAAEALSMGLIYSVVAAEELMSEALALAGRLATQPTRGLGLTKKLLNLSFESDLATQLKHEQELQAEAGRTHDYKEGVTAFLEKRKPVFRGK